MIAELVKIAGQCDGVRCDMAMLVLPEVFERTWGRRRPPFWPRAIGQRARAGARASASWPRCTGTSSGRCSSRASTTPTTSGCTTGCVRGTRVPVREHLLAGLDFQNKLARFLENHDEPRAAATLRSRHARGGRRHHVSVTGPAVLSSGTVRGLAGSGSRPTSSAGRRSRRTARCTSTTRVSSR